MGTLAVATKVAGYSDAITWLPERGGKGARVNRKQIRDSVESSLKRLGTDYIDLIQIHWPDREPTSNLPTPIVHTHVHRYVHECIHAYINACTNTRT